VSEKSEEFHIRVVKPIAHFMQDHPEDVNVASLRILLIVALVYQDSLDGGDRANQLLKALGR
jgi:hypothetical protein